jgi:hypothetical protein
VAVRLATILILLTVSVATVFRRASLRSTKETELINNASTGSVVLILYGTRKLVHAPVISLLLALQETIGINTLVVVSTMNLKNSHSALSTAKRAKNVKLIISGIGIIVAVRLKRSVI